LHRQIAQIANQAGASCIAAAFYDYESETAWSLRGDRWFHAASTIKVAVLLSVFAAAEQGRFTMDSPVHVRNRFLSVADGEPYRIEPGRDANAEVHSAIGKTLRVRELAHHMIVTSSNLATNLLVDLVGVQSAQQSLAELQIDGIELRRGVEDEKAFDININNRVTANGLLSLFRALYEGRALSGEASDRMLEILHQQQFNSGVPEGLPAEVRAEARFAHKTGEISTVAHDGGLVFLPNRKPYAVVILTEWNRDNNGQQETVAQVSKVIYTYLTETDSNENNGSNR
jgi:beta-lactamase class A